MAHVQMRCHPETKSKVCPKKYARARSIAHAMSAKFKAFSFLVIKSYSVVPVFRSSVIPHFPVSPVMTGFVLVSGLGFPLGQILLCLILNRLLVA